METVMTYTDWFITKDKDGKYLYIDKIDEEVYEVELVKTRELTGNYDTVDIHNVDFDFDINGEFDFCGFDKIRIGYFKRME